MEEPEHIEELARRLFAAAISCWTGVSLQHAYNNSLKSQENEIGPYWIELAKQVTAPIGSANPHLPIEPTFADRVELFVRGQWFDVKSARRGRKASRPKNFHAQR